MRIWAWIGRVDWGLASVGAGLCLLAMMLITVVSVFGRYVLGMNLVLGAYNIVERILFPLIVFWALPLAHREGTFPRLGFISEALPPRGQALLASVVLTIETAIFVACFTTRPCSRETGTRPAARHRSVAAIGQFFRC